MTFELYRNNLKNREFGNEIPQNFQEKAMLKQPLPNRQGLSEHENFEEKPTPPKTDSSGYFGMTILSIFRQSASYLPRYFSQIETAFALRGDRCHAVWLEGDSEDETYQLLEEEKKKLESLGHKVSLTKFDLKGPKWSSTNKPDRWRQLASCWNKCMEGLLPSKITVCVESDLIWEPSIIEQLIAKLDEEHHVICPMLMVEGGSQLWGFEWFYDIWGFSRNGKKFLFYPPYWRPDSALKEELECLQVSTCGGMLISTYEHQKKGSWALDCCIMHYPSTVKVFMDKTLKIYHPAPKEWANFNPFIVYLKKLKYRFLILLNRLCSTIKV